MPTQNDPYEHVRAVCLALPETNERVSHGEAAFFIKDKKLFVTCANNHHGDGNVAIWCACEKEIQQALVENEPQHYFVPPYVGVKGWLGVRLDTGLSQETIRAVIEDAFVLVAPKKVLEQLKGKGMED